jgi:hypothetical protein
MKMLAQGIWAVITSLCFAIIVTASHLKMGVEPESWE